MVCKILTPKKLCSILGLAAAGSKYIEQESITGAYSMLQTDGHSRICGTELMLVRRGWSGTMEVATCRQF